MPDTYFGSMKILVANVLSSLAFRVQTALHDDNALFLN